MLGRTRKGGPPISIALGRARGGIGIKAGALSEAAAAAARKSAQAWKAARATVAPCDRNRP
jgi:hypothetical protein